MGAKAYAARKLHSAFNTVIPIIFSVLFLRLFRSARLLWVVIRSCKCVSADQSGRFRYKSKRTLSYVQHINMSLISQMLKYKRQCAIYSQQLSYIYTNVCVNFSVSSAAFLNTLLLFKLSSLNKFLTFCCLKKKKIL